MKMKMPARERNIKRINQFLAVLRDESELLESQTVRLTNELLAEYNLDYFEASHVAVKLQKQGIINCQTIYKPGNFAVGGLVVEILDENKIDQYLPEQKMQEKDIRLTLFHDGYLCPIGAKTKNECYLFRNRMKGLRKKMITHLANNPGRIWPGTELAREAGYDQGSSATKDIKDLFESVSKKLKVPIENLIDSDDNGHKLVCTIEIIDQGFGC